MYENIPIELRQLPQWISVDMSIDPETGQPCKRPLNPRTGRWASITDPSDWGTFDECVKLGRPIGFILTSADPYCIIDLDNKPHNPATPAQLALHNDILTGIESYIERSISGTGYHVVVFGAIPHGVNYGKVELYSSGRMMIFTGDVVKQMPIADYNDAVNNMFNQMVEMQERNKQTTELVQVDGDLSDADIMSIASEAENYVKFNELCAGRWQQYGYPSQSEADFALMSMFTFYSKDNAQCRRLFRLTVLGKREKYQESDNWLNRMLEMVRAKEPKPVDLDAIKTKVAEVMATLVPEVEPVIGVTITPPDPPVPMLDVPPPPKLDILNPPGVLALMADYMYQSSAYRAHEYSVCASIAMLAGIAARSFNISRTGLNQYLIVLGGAGTGKESMASGIGRLTQAINQGIGDPKPVDIGKFASVQGLQKALIAQPCALSIIGEVAGEFKIMLSPKCDPNRAEIKNAYLNLYNKSGHGESYSAVTYSKSENNMVAVPSPNLSLLGESVPHRFYETITEASSQDGFLSRLMVVEYLGLREDLNEETDQPVPDSLVKWLSSIRDHAADLQARNLVQRIDIEPTAAKLLRQYAKDITSKINQAAQSGSLGVAELLVRSHVKVLKLAGLGAVAINHYNPVVTQPLAEWAMAFVNKADSVMTTRFQNGDLGEMDDTHAERIIRTAVMHYFKLTPAQRIEKRSPKVLSETNFIAHSFIRDFCKRREPFKSHKLGHAKGLEIALDDCVKSGILVKILPTQLPKATNGHQMVVYGLGEQF